MKKNVWILENGMYISWAVALIATLGSLYFSEVLEYIPCKLCWFQRIFMYPLVIILGIAAVRKDIGQSKYVLPMSVVGGCISLYHYLIQKTDLIPERGKTCGIVPCDVEYINWFGFVTIPFLALTAFTLITLAQIWMIRANKRHTA